MDCLSWDFIQHVLILIVVLVGTFAIIEILIGIFSDIPAWVVQILRVIKWMVVTIICIILVIGLIKCLWGLIPGGPLNLGAKHASLFINGQG